MNILESQLINQAYPKEKEGLKMQYLVVKNKLNETASNIIKLEYAKKSGLKHIAWILNEMGFVSSRTSRKPISTSHVSNAARRCLGLRMREKYEKPGYKGKNWRSFATCSEQEFVYLFENDQKALLTVNDYIFNVIKDTQNKSDKTRVYDFACNLKKRIDSGIPLTLKQLQGLANCIQHME